MKCHPLSFHLLFLIFTLLLPFRHALSYPLARLLHPPPSSTPLTWLPPLLQSFFFTNITIIAITIAVSNSSHERQVQQGNAAGQGRTVRQLVRQASVLQYMTFTCIVIELVEWLIPIISYLSCGRGTDGHGCPIAEERADATLDAVLVILAVVALRMLPLAHWPALLAAERDEGLGQHLSTEHDEHGEGQRGGGRDGEGDDDEVATTLRHVRHCPPTRLQLSSVSSATRGLSALLLLASCTIPHPAFLPHFLVPHAVALTFLSAALTSASLVTAIVAFYLDEAGEAATPSGQPTRRFRVTLAVWLLLALCNATLKLTWPASMHSTFVTSFYWGMLWTSACIDLAVVAYLMSMLRGGSLQLFVPPARRRNNHDATAAARARPRGDDNDDDCGDDDAHDDVDADIAPSPSTLSSSSATASPSRSQAGPAARRASSGRRARRADRSRHVLTASPSTSSVTSASSSLDDE